MNRPQYHRNSFEGGMNKDLSPNKVPANAYIDALNFMEMNEDGSIYERTNERGTEELDSYVVSPNAPGVLFQVIGHYVLNNEVVLWSVSVDGTLSEIGVLDRDRVYTSIITSDELNFSIEHEIDAEGRIYFDKDRVVYWTDDFNPPRILNLDDIPEDNIAENTDLFINQTLPVTRFSRIIEQQGSVFSGSYQFITRYLDDTLNPTFFGLITKPIGVNDDFRSEGRSKYDGATEGKVTTKSIELTVDNIDTDFNFLELVVIVREGAAGIPNAYVVQRKEITTSSDVFVFSGLQGEEEAIDISEVILERPSYGTAKCINQIDNRLVLSNLSAPSETGLQELTNQISLRYQIDEIEYQDDTAPTVISGSNEDDEGFRVVNAYFQLKTDEDGNTAGQNILALEFSRAVDKTSIVTTNFALIKVVYTGGSLVNTRITPDNVFKENNVIYLDFSVTGIDFTDDTLYNLSDFDLIDTAAGDHVPLYTWGCGSILDTISGAGTPDLVVEGGTDTYTNAGGAFSSQDTCTVTETSGVVVVDTVSVPSVRTDSIAVYGSNHTTFNQGLFAVLEVGDPDASLLTIDSTATGNDGAGTPVITDTRKNIVQRADSTVQTSGVLPNDGYFGDYIDEALAADGRTYLREETYSKSISYIFSNGSISSPLHIPGRLRTAAGEAIKDIPLYNEGITYLAGDVVTFRGNVYRANQGVGLGQTPETNPNNWDYDSTTLQKGWVGTYESEETYPTSGEYPTASGADSQYSNNSKIRHHKMPSNVQEPFFKTTPDGRVFIRRIGLIPVWEENGVIRSINDLIEQSEFSSRVVGFIIGREIRDSALKRSIAMQGVGQNLWHHQGGDIKAHGDDSQKEYLSNSYFFGKTSITYTKDRVYPRHDLNNGVNGWGSSDIRRDLVQFYSPDITLLDREVPAGVRIKPVMSIIGEIRQKAKFRPQITRFAPKAGLVHLFCSYTTAGDPTIVIGDNSPTVLDVYRTSPADDTFLWAQTKFSEIDIRVANYYNEGYTLLNLGEGNSLPLVDNNVEIDYDIYISKINQEGYNKGTSFGERTEIKSSTNFLSKRALYNLVFDNDRQYGTLDASEYTNAAVFEDRTAIVDPEDALYFGGDIFISKFAYKNSGTWRWAVNTRRQPSQDDDNDRKVPYVQNARNFGEADSQGEELRAIGYFFVESEVNCNWRHVSDLVGGGTGVDYYPNNPKVTGLTGRDQNATQPDEGEYGVLDYSPLLRDSTGYNKSYSSQDLIGTQISNPFGFQEVTDYSNRTIYSDQSIEGQAEDKYRFFKANNFHDIPRSSGEITNTAILGNIFYHQTTDSLWRSYVNERTAVPTTEGEVILGNGGMFPIPSKEVLTIDGGHAGLQNQFAVTVTPYGIIWVDQFRGKLFRLAGQENVEEITNLGMINWFAENIRLSNSDDNPSNPSANGIRLGYDKRYRRVMITKRDTENPFTLSFSLLSNTFTSFHSYLPTRYMSVEDRLYAVDNQHFDVQGLRVWEHHKGNYGKFYNEDISPSTITVAVNPDYEIQKVFDNLVILSESTNQNKVEQLEDTFDRIQVYNTNKNTGVIDIVPNLSGVNTDNTKTKVVRRNDEFRLFVPPDAVIDKNQDIFDSANLTLSLPVGDLQRLYRPRVKGKYAVVELTYLNQDNNKLVVDSILSKRGINAL
jgi:hypothetical protein